MTIISAVIVAPTTTLEYAQPEVQNILRSGLRVRPVFSPVTLRDLTREVQAGDEDMIFFLAHGSADGILLDDKDPRTQTPVLLSPAALVQLVRNRYRLVYLNTCSSLELAQLIQNETGAAVICTLTNVPDRDAYVTGSLFAASLARHGDVARAYKESLPGANRLYLYLAATDFLTERTA